jgi:membrane-associated phospholipid phosphatase
MLVEKSTNEQIIADKRKPPLPLELRHPSPLRLIDYATFVYLGVIALLLLIFHRGVENWLLLVFLHLALGGFLFGFIQFTQRRASIILTFFRDVYPFILYTFMFKEISLIINILFPFWLEEHLIHWDLALFGNHPTVWLQHLNNPSLREWMAFFYWSYYIFIPIVCLTLYFRKDRALFHSYTFSISLTLYICYFLFLFLGARGPHETLAHLHAQKTLAGFFDKMVYSIQSNAAISGAAFPSSHVAAMWVAWIFLFKFRRVVGWVCLPLVLALSFSVVYMQYHYAVDSFAGIILVAFTYPLSHWLENKFRLRSAP